MAESSTTLPTAEPETANLVEIGAYRSVAEGSEHGLVVLAMERPYWLIPEEGSMRLLVEPEIAATARAQLECFDREAAAGWPPRPVPDDAQMRPLEVITPMLWSLMTLAIFRWQLEWPALTALAALNPKAIFTDGEWWRVATALLVHADPAHVISNTLSGVLVFAAAVTTLGTLRGWLLVAAAGVAANFAVASLRAEEAYRSLGASTAIFAGLGLLTGRAMRLAVRGNHPHRWRAVLAPFAAGAAMLGLYGAGGLRVDVGAHVAGYVAGLALGYVAGTGTSGRFKPAR